MSFPYKPFNEDEAQEVIECVGNLVLYSEATKKPFWFGIDKGVASILTDTGNVVIAPGLHVRGNIYGNVVGHGGWLTGLDASNLATGTIDAARAPYGMFSGDIRVINGNVGVGITDPKAKLHLDGSVRIEPKYLQPQTNPATEIFPNTQTYIAFGSGAALTDAARLVQEGDNNNLGLALELYNDGNESFSIRQVRNYGGNLVSNVFYAGGANGRVGINTRSPVDTLDVAGGSFLRGNVNIVGGGRVLNFGTPVQNNIVCLWGDSTNPNSFSKYGFGVNSSTLRYDVNASTSRHSFYGGGQLYANITADGFSTLANVRAQYIFGNGALLTGLNASQLVSGTLDAARFPVLGSLGVGTATPSANLEVLGNALVSGNIRADRYYGNGALLENLDASKISIGTIHPARLPVLSNLGVGTASPSANLEVLGNITASGNISGKYFFGDGSFLTGISGASLGSTIDATQIVSGTINKDRLPSELHRTHFGLGFTTANIDCAGIATVMGNLAVANTNPTSRLSVNGNAFIAGDLALPLGYIDLGLGHTGRQADAGKVWYGGALDSSALNVVGYGNSSERRRVKVWNNLDVAGNVLATHATFSSSTSPQRILFQTTQGGVGSSVRLAFNTYLTSPPCGELRFEDTGLFTGKFVFSTKAPGAATNALVDRVTIDSGGIYSSKQIVQVVSKRDQWWVNNDWYLGGGVGDTRADFVTITPKMSNSVFYMYIFLKLDWDWDSTSFVPPLAAMKSGVNGTLYDGERMFGLLYNTQLRGERTSPGAGVPFDVALIGNTTGSGSSSLTYKDVHFLVIEVAP